MVYPRPRYLYKWSKAVFLSIFIVSLDEKDLCLVSPVLVTHPKKWTENEEMDEKRYVSPFVCPSV